MFLDFCTSFIWLVDYQNCLLFGCTLCRFEEARYWLWLLNMFFCLPCDFSKVSDPHLISSIGLGMFCTWQTIYLCLSPAIFQIMHRSTIPLWSKLPFYMLVIYSKRRKGTFNMTQKNWVWQRNEPPVNYIVTWTGRRVTSNFLGLGRFLRIRAFR